MRTIERILTALAVIVVLLGLGVWGGTALTRGHYEPLLADANKQIGALTTANSAMKASVEKQNSAIAALKAEETRRNLAAEKATQQARQKSIKEQAKAQELLTTQPPPGLGQCAAARAAFDEELRLERGLK